MHRQLLRDGPVGGVVFAGHQKSRGILVDSVDDSRPELPIDAGKAVPAVEQQGVYQGACAVACRRVHHHALGFIDHDEILILVDDVQGDVFRQERRFLRSLRLRQLDQIPLIQQVAAFYLAAVYGDAPLFQLLLYMRTTHTLQKL